MKRLVFASFILVCQASAASAAGLTLTIHDGLVSIDAQDVTVSQILTEWARVGKTRIVNAERITGGPITLKLDAVPEKQALDTILRSIPGYMAMPRATLTADASLYDRILIMPTTAAVAAPRPQRPIAGFPGIPTPPGAPGGANVTQLRPNFAAAMPPGAMPESANAADDVDDPAIAAAAAAGLVTAPGIVPGPGGMSAPLTLPGAPNQSQPTSPAAGAGAPSNPWNAPIGTAQPSLAPPQPPAQPQPPARVRPPQADR
jgi:hypothetical protein